jgi:hypothetical protein
VTIFGLSGLTGHHRGKSQSTVHELRDTDLIIQESCWANLPPELLRDVIRRLEASESTWPNRKNVVSCAAVCRAWREMCREIVLSPEFCGKLTFPVSLKQPGHRDGMIQCFIKRDKSKSTYHLYLCLSTGMLHLSFACTSISFLYCFSIASKKYFGKCLLSSSIHSGTLFWLRVSNSSANYFHFWFMAQLKLLLHFVSYV